MSSRPGAAVKKHTVVVLKFVGAGSSAVLRGWLRAAGGWCAMVYYGVLSSSNDRNKLEQVLNRGVVTCLSGVALVGVRVIWSCHLYLSSGRLQVLY
jgi:hypothetical protein